MQIILIKRRVTMISPDSLRRYPPLKVFDDAALAIVAQATEELTCAPGEVLFETDQPANGLYFLMSGVLELWIVSSDRNGNGFRNFYPAGEIRSGEFAGISALVPPYVYTATGQITKPSSVLNINALTLRELAAGDPRLDSALMHIVAEATMRRLHDARVQLLTARK